MSPAETDLWKVANRLPGALLLLDLDGNLVEANGQARTLLGIEGDIKGIALSSRLAGNRESLHRYLKICSGSLQPLPGRFVFKGADGEPVHRAVSGSRVDVAADKPSDGRVMLWSTESSEDSAHARFATLNSTINQLTVEINARRQAEALLQAEKHVLEMIVNGEPLDSALGELALAVEEHTASLVASFLLMDETGRLRHVAAPSLSKRFTGAIDGMGVGTGTVPFAVATSNDEAVVVTDIASDSLWQNYRDMALQEGLQACWSTPVRGPDGSVLGVFGLYDRSTRSPTEAELRLIKNCALIAGITVAHFRTQKNLAAMLDNEHKQREQAENESRAKDHFLAILSHELRNPLSAAANAAYALEALGESDQQRTELQTIIVNSTGMLKRILDDLLDLGRLNTGKLGLLMEPFDFTGMMAELIATFRTTYPDRQLHYACSGDVLWVDGDRARMQQTVNNLLGNALKYSGNNDVISVELCAGDHELQLSVRDTGQGIDASLLPRIFTAFVQSDQSLGRTDSGLGLGLALVRQFAEMHGGSICANSDGLGLGSEFVLRLPRSCAPEKGLPEHQEAPESPCLCQIMVIEDNAEARLGLCRLLERWGHQVTPAANGEEALQLMRENPPEVALVDIGLPGISGYEVARTARSEPALAKIKLIALTGYGQEKDRELTTQAGFDKHLVKPVDMADLTGIFGARRAR